MSRHKTKKKNNAVLSQPVVSTIILFIFYHPPSFIQLHGKKTRKRDEIKQIDFIGLFLLTAGLALFLLGVSWGGSPAPWNSPKILGLLISGTATCVLFVLYECFGNVSRPIIPMRLFRDLRGFACLTVIESVMGVMNIAYPQQITYIFGSTISGWEQTAWMLSTAAFGIWTGILLLGSVFHIVRQQRSLHQRGQSSGRSSLPPSSPSTRTKSPENCSRSSSLRHCQPDFRSHLSQPFSRPSRQAVRRQSRPCRG